MICAVETCEKQTRGNRKHCGAHAARLSRTGSLQESVPIGTFFHKHAKRTGTAKRTSTYNSWRGMIHRCTNPNADSWAYYGGKGIKVFSEWRDFRNFLKDMGAKPSCYHTIGRKDSDKDYCPTNCRWETWKQQAAVRMQNAK